jgi:hypothetical protein
MLALAAFACGGADRGSDAAEVAAEPAADTTPAAVPPDAWMLMPGRGAVGLGPDATHERLLVSLGREFVGAQRLVDEDGDSVPGSVLFPDDSTRRLEILWRDTSGMAHPAVLRVRGTESRWRLFPGIALGESKLELERRAREAMSSVRFDGDRARVFVVEVAPPDSLD